MGDYKYVLTRICLRNAELTLPGSMLGLFPENETVTVTDKETGEDLELTVKGKRTVQGVGPFLKEHSLEVNDEIHIEKDGEKLYLRPLKRERNQSVYYAEAVSSLLDTLYEEKTPYSVEEIRELYPTIPSDLDLALHLKEDNRFFFDSGRWHTALTEVTPELVTEEEPSYEKPALDLPPAYADESSDLQTTLVPEELSSSRISVTPMSTGSSLPSDMGLASADDRSRLTQQHQLRDLLSKLGFRVESLAYRHLLVHAELGRKHFSALIHLLPDNAQVDWAGLLAQRRETGATYLAVVADHRDLVRLTAPAGMARATLWSWSGVKRLEDLAKVVLISPYDLESHFERDGLFDHGLDRFERDISKRIIERGAFSSVLSRLALMKAPAIFILDEAVEGDTSRESVLKVLDLLSQAPFHLIAKVDNGEYCLRYKVSEALLQLSEYALSLRTRLPARTKERIRSSPDIPVLYEVEVEEHARLSDEQP